MKFQTPLIRARLIRRYKRFLSDMELEDGQIVVAHCPNPGAMTGMKEAGTNCWLEPNDDPKKKLKYGWRLAELPDKAMVGIDTGLANKIVEEAVLSKSVEAFADYQTMKREVKYGDNSRIDFLLSQHGKKDIFVEVKSVTLRRAPGLAEFPDTVTKRGAKHLVELSKMVAAGHRAAMLYLVQRTDCDVVSVAADIDESYAVSLCEAVASGVEVFAYDCEISPLGIRLNKQLPFKLPEI